MRCVEESKAAGANYASLSLYIIRYVSVNAALSVLMHRVRASGGRTFRWD